MTFKRLSEYFYQLESTSLRNKMTEILASLFKEAEATEIEKLCYLLQGRVAPLYEAIEFGVADKMMIRVVAAGLSMKEKDVIKSFKHEGDLGNATAKLKTQSSQPKADRPLAEKLKAKTKNLKITEVYDVLYKLATASGKGSQEQKIKLLGGLLKDVDPLSARYIVRITLSKLRLGFSDMTILDALSWMLKGDKSEKLTIEKAYNVRPDLGYIAKLLKEKGLKGLSHINPTPGTPILMARANRLTSSQEILEKIGKCAIEYKYDGLRLQVHKEHKTIKIFSRNLEDVTSMFPDVKEAVEKQVKAESAIFEGEVVAYNPDTGVFVPFQETMQRKRKYDIKAKAIEIPVKLFVFELLFRNGESLLDAPYMKRKEHLREIIAGGTLIQYAKETVTESHEKIEEVFEDSIAKHFEGIIAKKLAGSYEAGVRGWNWIKFKKAMSKKLADTVDAVVMGYSWGEGKRTSFGVGQFLAGVYDEKTDTFVTISKIGTGLTDEQFREFFERVKPFKVRQMPKNYSVDKLFYPNVWLEPKLVVEIACDEITRSAVHTTGRVMGPSKSGTAQEVKTPGFALRFPRLERFRDDKTPMDSTTVDEIARMFNSQK